MLSPTLLLPAPLVTFQINVIHQCNRIVLCYPCVSLVAQMVKNPSAMQETQVQPLGQEDAPGKGMVTHFRVLDWRIPWTEEPDGLQSMGLQRAGHD